jgi:hypothetical protein
MVARYVVDLLAVVFRDGGGSHKAIGPSTVWEIDRDSEDSEGFFPNETVADVGMIVCPGTDLCPIAFSRDGSASGRFSCSSEGALRREIDGGTRAAGQFRDRLPM